MFRATTMNEAGHLVISQYSPRSFLVFCLSGTVITLVSVREFVTIGKVHGVDSAMWFSVFFSLLMRTLSSLLMWIVWIYKRKSDRKGKQWLQCCENSYHPLLMLSICVRVITEDVESISPAYLVAMMFIPIGAFFIIRDTNLIAIALTWTMAVGTMVFCVAHMNSTVLILTTASYSFASAVIVYEAKRQNDTVLALVRALQFAATENEKLFEEARATELRAMIGNVAHDLKTPLTSLMNGIECIEECMRCIHDRFLSSSESERGGTSSQLALEQVASVRLCLSGMLGTTSFMTMCINRCLDYTKASKGVKLVPRPETVNLQEVLDFPVKILRDVQTHVVITVAPIPPGIDPHIVTDKQWLLENLLCLLSNAVKYSQDGSVDVKVCPVEEDFGISKSANASGTRSIRFEVWDTGVGLTESAKSTLFAPFQQAQRLAGGTGLGLFSLARRVEALHGHYGVCPRPDGVPGSLFWFSIPYRTVARKATSENALPSYALACAGGLTQEEEETRRRRAPGGIPKRVLVVDDAPSILKMTAMLLAKKGHIVEKAANGALAVDMVRDALRRSPGGRFDVVLMDLQMPVLDGTEAIRRIRAAERTRREQIIGNDELVDLESGCVEPFRAPTRRRQLIIALSANSDSETMQEALNAGADYFMSKPFTYDTFLDLVTKREESDVTTVRG